MNPEELEQTLQTWLEDGTLPTLAIWHGRHGEEFKLSDGRTGGGDCEVTAFALYRDLRRARLDANWTLVCGELANIGYHYWNVYQPGNDAQPGSNAQAVNVNLGEIRVSPLINYLTANGGIQGGLHSVQRQYTGRIYAAAARVGNGRACTAAEACALDKLMAEAFNTPTQLPHEMHETVAREAGLNKPMPRIV